ncbi:MAG: allantoate amidohydrolase [Holophagales bacterium]|nr:allantoate amidohydrolase [Holophagales bacterium]
MARVLARCDHLARISDEPGRITRSYFSPALERAMARVADWMEKAGLAVERDGAGNGIGVLPSGRSGAPVLVLGSHLDTVRDAGRYDGVLGVLLALEVAASFGPGDLPFDLEVVAFADEEGLRFGAPFLGSRALVGELDAGHLALTDARGMTLAGALRAWRGKGSDPVPPPYRYRDRRTLGYLEAHIEQGPWLEARELPVGVLECLCAARWLRLRFAGRAGHAGTTPMDLRRDPMPAAAEVVIAAERLAREREGLVATVGSLEVSPGAGNVIPGEVELRLDVRHPNVRALEAAVAELLDSGHDAARRRHVELTVEILSREDGAEADPLLAEMLAEAASRAGVAAGSLVCGAGHDALILARHMPMAMLLLRSPGGVSHHPDEAVLLEDVEAAFRVMRQFVEQMAGRVAPETAEAGAEKAEGALIGARG